LGSPSIVSRSFSAVALICWDMEVRRCITLVGLESEQRHNVHAIPPQWVIYVTVMTAAPRRVHLFRIGLSQNLVRLSAACFVVVVLRIIWTDDSSLPNVNRWAPRVSSIRCGRYLPRQSSKP
jgi:hypothetical protein